MPSTKLPARFSRRDVEMMRREYGSPRAVLDVSVAKTRTIGFYEHMRFQRPSASATGVVFGLQLRSAGQPESPLASKTALFELARKRQ